MDSGCSSHLNVANEIPESVVIHPLLGFCFDFLHIWSKSKKVWKSTQLMLDLDICNGIIRNSSYCYKGIEYVWCKKNYIHKRHHFNFLDWVFSRFSYIRISQKRWAETWNLFFLICYLCANKLTFYLIKVSSQVMHELSFTK